MSGQVELARYGIGDTPLVPLPGLVPAGEVLLKAEYVNPFGSVKDRTAAYLLRWAREVEGRGVRVVESTSGNLGVALARLGRAVGLPCTLVMDASAPNRRIATVRRLGARVELVRRPRPGKTFRQTRIELADEVGGLPGHVWLNQYANRAGMRAHLETTGPEILRTPGAPVEAVVASAGTGGTICGIGAAAREVSRPPLVVGVEPAGSTISGGADGDYLPAGSGMRGVPGIVEEFGELIDRFAHVPDPVAACWALSVHRRYGIRVGQTTGAAIAVAALLARRDGLRVVAIAPDEGEDFLPDMRRLACPSRLLDDDAQIDLRDFPGYRQAAAVSEASR